MKLVKPGTKQSCFRLLCGGRRPACHPGSESEKKMKPKGLREKKTDVDRQK